MINNKRLVIFSEAERFALYGFPDFNDKQRAEYFSFSENELKLIMKNQNDYINIHCALLLGYFKAKKMFFKISWNMISKEDIQFIICNYFYNEKLRKKNYITKHEYYNQRQEISAFFGYQLWSKDFFLTLFKQAEYIIRRDITPNFIARELIYFLNERKVVRPSYSTLQKVVSKSLLHERNRISTMLDTELNTECKLLLEKLLAGDDNISQLAAIKQDAKNFGFKMMLKERQKQNMLEPLYNFAKDALKKLDISKQNIDTYLSFVHYYDVNDLRNLKYNQGYLYLLCYVFKRYRQINDNLVEAFTYHIKKTDNNLRGKVNKNFAEEQAEPQKKIGNLLLLYVDDKFDDTMSFAKVRKRAFRIMPKEDIQTLGDRMLNESKFKKEFRWREVDRAQKTYKKNLRPLFMKLTFSSELQNNPWFTSVKWLQGVFASNQRLSERPFSECPEGTIPKHLHPYLIENKVEETKTINANRYEYWLYRQINKQISTGGLYIEDSIHNRYFKHELVITEQKEEILKTLDVPWLQQSADKQLDTLLKKLNDLWLKINRNLKTGKLRHLKYDEKKQRLHLCKTKSNKDEKLQNNFYNQLPLYDITDLLHFVDDECNFLSAFTPLPMAFG